MKTTRVHYNRLPDGRLHVSALVTAQDDAEIQDDSWDTLVQVLKLMNTVVNAYLHWDRDTWDDFQWG